jgi:predicted ThiF/HesA family dinucleotide-utilizing enzyme
MNKQYLVSLDTNQEANDVQAIKSQLTNLNIELVNDLGVNVLVVKIPGNDALKKVQAIKGVAAVEEDLEMGTL